MEPLFNKEDYQAQIPLASSLHDFKSDIGEAYEDLRDSFDRARKGIGLLADIPFLKNGLFPVIHVPILRKNKSGHYYLRKLSRSERKAFMKANRTDMRFVPLQDWLDSKFLDMEDFLGSSFIWAESSEGHDYWEMLNTKARWATEGNTIIPQDIEDALYVRYRGSRG